MHEIVVTSAPLEERGQLTKTVDDLSREVTELSPSTITDGEWDLLYSVHGQEAELYRTKEDPGHMNNLISQHRDIAERLHAQFYAWLEEIGTAEKYLAPRREL